MPSLADHQPLSDQECDRLGDFLEKAGDRNLEWVDGYFAALICGPDFVPPTEGLNEIIGDDDVVFDTQDEAREVVGLLMRHWNTIASELERSVAEDHVYLPLLLENDQGIVKGNEWAKGFMRGVQARPASWSELLDSDEYGGAVFPMMMLAHENDPDPEMRPPPITEDKREDIVAHMIAGLTRIHRHFEPARRLYSRMPPSTPMRRSATKIGRNDPCPCGSGRKYKHCCALKPH